MPSLFVIFKGLKVAERRHLRFYTEDLFPSIFDAQLHEHTELSRRYNYSHQSSCTQKPRYSISYNTISEKRKRPPSPSPQEQAASSAYSESHPMRTSRLHTTHAVRTQSARSTSCSTSCSTSSHGTSSYSTSSYSMSAYNTSPSSAHDPKPWQDQTLDDIPWTLQYEIAKDRPLELITEHTIPYVLSFAMEKAVDHNRIMALYPESHRLIPDKCPSFAKVYLPYNHREVSSYSSSSIQVDDRASVPQLAKHLYDYYPSFDLNLLQLPARI